MNSHMKLGVDYLIGIGYTESDIVTNDVYKGFKIDTKNIGRPDLTTKNDGKEWEIKVVHPISVGKTIIKRDNMVIFTESQLRMHKDVNVLIFRKNHNELEKIIKFGDILSGKNHDYAYIVDFRVDMSVAVEILEYFNDKISESRQKFLIFEGKDYGDTEDFGNYIIKKYGKRGKRALYNYSKDRLDILGYIMGYSNVDKEDMKYLNDDEKKELNGSKSREEKKLRDEFYREKRVLEQDDIKRHQ